MIITGVLVLLLGLVVIASGAFVPGSSVVFLVIGLPIIILGITMTQGGFRARSRLHF